MKNTLTTTLRSVQELPALVNKLSDFAKGRELSGDEQYKLVLIVDELITNCLNHGPCSKGKTEIHVVVEDRPGDIEVRISDSGTPFDPTQYDCPPCTDPETIMPGGVGLCLVRNLAATMNYYRQQEQNILILTITKTL